ncbi:MAG: penicillin-binding protein 2 [Paludibacteraceae bacterium]|nr:penicillin-binding protein 2 [Paludibacteraceae bacterium]
MINDQNYNRRYVISAIAIGIVALFIVRLFFLQVLDDTARDKADNMSLLRQTVYAPRGLIYDRNGELLVYNQPIYEITMVYREMGQNFDTASFCYALRIRRDYFEQRTREVADRSKNPGFSRDVPQIFMTQLAAEDIAPLQESLDKFPGIGIRKRTLRDYPYACGAQVLGSIGEVNKRDIERDDYYQSGDYSGREGIERTYETVLRGEKGVEVLLRDNKGRVRGPYRNGELDRAPVAGEDLMITLDIHLQMLAEELLEGKIGSVVAIEPATGEILVMASNPTWDPKILVGRQRSANYMQLLTDKTKPLMNRATQAQYSPGSTFKTLQALICQQEGAITPNKPYPCSGPGSTPIKCTHHHGSPVTLIGAIEQSCNPYFWCAFRDMLEKDGYGKNNEHFRARYKLWCEDAKSFGLGSRFEDSDISEQSAGKIPSIELYDRYYGKTGWRALTIRSNAIGQGEVLVTPLQLANLAATIANEGYYITPHLLKNDSMLTHIHHTAVEKRYFQTVKQGMRRVMTNGTGRHHALPDSIASAGKTGTVQNKGGRDHAIFIGYAPADDPKIAVAVVVENAGFGATWAAPIATLIEEQYLIGEIKRKDKKQYIASTVLNSNAKKWVTH